jgi:hypothetical protein
VEDDASGLRHGPRALEDAIPIGASVALVVGLAMIAIGVRRWIDGDGRLPDGWLLTSAFLFVWGGLHRVVVRRRWHRLYRVLGIDPDDIGKTGVYRPPPDPRRTRRQRIIDAFSDDLDRSNEPRSHSLAARSGRVLTAILSPIVDISFPFAPLLALVFGLRALDLVYIGVWWSATAARRLRARG